MTKVNCRTNLQEMNNQDSIDEILNENFNSKRKKIDNYNILQNDAQGKVDIDTNNSKDVISNNNNIFLDRSIDIKKILKKKNLKAFDDNGYVIDKIVCNGEMDIDNDLSRVVRLELRHPDSIEANFNKPNNMNIEDQNESNIQTDITRHDSLSDFKDSVEIRIVNSEKNSDAVDDGDFNITENNGVTDVSQFHIFKIRLNRKIFAGHVIK